ncbi:hypothetical protein BaRGS_00021117, partial [Batillaria attramentaria]
MIRCSMYNTEFSPSRTNFIPHPPPRPVHQQTSRTLPPHHVVPDIPLHHQTQSIAPDNLPLESQHYPWRYRGRHTRSNHHKTAARGSIKRHVGLMQVPRAWRYVYWVLNVTLLQKATVCNTPASEVTKVYGIIAKRGEVIVAG